jgi:hypothetical protein
MIKQLLFTAALLLPGLAYSGNPSADLSGQVVPAGSGPAVPAPAQALGFTTLAFSTDFTQTLPAGWLNCNFDQTPAQWYFGYDAGDPYAADQLPCSQVSQKTDPVYGNMALDMDYPASASGTGTYGKNVLNIQSANFDSSGNWVGTFIPHGYFEIVYRYVPPTGHSFSPFSPEAAFWLAAGLKGDSAYELDVTEMWQDRGTMNGNIIDWTGGVNILQTFAIPYSSINIQQYHKYAALVTGMGNGTTEAACAFVDDVFQGCNSTNSGVIFNPHYFMMSNSVGCSEQGDSSCAPGNSFTDPHVWVKTVRVWSCSGWNTGSLCPTTAKTSGP